MNKTVKCGVIVGMSSFISGIIAGYNKAKDEKSKTQREIEELHQEIEMLKCALDKYDNILADMSNSDMR